MEKHTLFANNWTVRIGDPGEEGANSHLFETTYVELEAQWDGKQLSYVFTRKTEESLELEQRFTELAPLFKFVEDYMDTVSIGITGVKIGQLYAQYQL